MDAVGRWSNEISWLLRLDLRRAKYIRASSVLPN